MIASWRYGSYRIMAVIVMVVFLITGMAMTVSADFATVDKYGFFYYNGNGVTQINVGDTIPLNKNPYSARWSVSGLSPDYTYDIFLDIFTDSAIDFTKLSTTSSGSDTHVYYSINNPNLWYNTTTTSSWTLLSGVNGSIEKISDKHVKFHIFYNYNLSGLKYSSLQLCMNFGATAGGISNLKVVSQGCGAYYDPGGTIYEEILTDIKNQLHAGDDKLDSIPSNNVELETKVSELESIESSIVSASDPDGDAVDKFAEQGKSAVTTVNTSYRATFAFINSLVTKVMDDLGFGAIVFVSLTLGLISFILGRIK